ncbi:MAG: hypothetical protein KIT33_02040 [Candidatus Kapabacteria bacterium]|nr:hypothetical protein [Ignavibacteriota bacterium]MCW5883733.1 hypothetical protein [Candidatus Kapabacteria bacterium]
MTKSPAKKKIKQNHIIKHQKLEPRDFDILKSLRNGSLDVINIHEKLSQYSDQEISLTLSSLETKNYIKKIRFTHPSGVQTVSYQLDSLGRDLIYKK